MARYSKIDRRIWNDEKFRRLSRPQPCGQFLFLYLLTNPFVGPIPGVYSAGEAMLAEALEWDIDEFRKGFREAVGEGLVKADFGARLIWIPNAIRYNEPASINVVTGWRDTWDELPECGLKREAWEGLRVALEAKGMEWLKAFDDACPEPSAKGSAKGMPKPSAKPLANQEQEQEQEQDQDQINSLAHPSAEPKKQLLSVASDKRFSKTPLTGFAAEVYSVYPRKVGKADALKAIVKAIITVANRGATEKHPDFGRDACRAKEWLKSRTLTFAESPEGRRTDTQFVPYPATWFNGARYYDDVTEWCRMNTANSHSGSRPATYTAAEDPSEGFEEILSRPRPAWAEERQQ